MEQNQKTEWTLKECLDQMVKNGLKESDPIIVIDQSRMEVSYRYLQAEPWKDLLNSIVNYITEDDTMYGCHTFAFVMKPRA